MALDMATGACRLALLLVLLNAASTSGATFKKYNLDLKGTTLILDVNSLYAGWRGDRGPPRVTGVGDCEQACSQLPGCTGYTYCSKSTGCGIGCKAYVAKNPTPKLTPNWEAGLAKRNLPYSWFGPTGYTKACNADKWPVGLCSLKVASSATKPAFWTTKAEGWISGVLSQPAACNGVSAATCDACKKSKNPAACYKCALAASTAAAKRKAIFGGSPWTAGCVACVALPAGEQAPCAGCLAQDLPCGQCAADKQAMSYLPIDVSTCSRCTLKKPYAKCLECSQGKTFEALLACVKN